MNKTAFCGYLVFIISLLKILMQCNVILFYVKQKSHLNLNEDGQKIVLKDEILCNL